MTAAQIREACRLLDQGHEPDSRIVTLTEIGSEGAVFQLGAPLVDRGPRILIARDGSSHMETA